MLEEQRPKSNSISVIILFGLLSVICAEVFSGSAPLWMYDLWGLLVVLPLYWGHGLILWNIALRYRKTSLTHLYLLGIIYGLYESWMTKVIWEGYMEASGPQFGQFLGFAIGEFMIIALFWHAIFSFIVPLMIFHILGNLGPSYSITKARSFLFVLIILVASMFIPSGLSFDLYSTLLAYGTNVLLLFAAFFFTRGLNPDGFSLESLRLGKRGFAITISYTAFLYVFLLLVLFPERIAPLFTLLLTIGFYILVIALFYFSPEHEFPEESIQKGFSTRHIFYGIMGIGILIVIWFLIWSTGLPFVIANLLYLGMMLMGPVLFFIALVRVLRKKM
jgi:hypothetical protein